MQANHANHQVFVLFPFASEIEHSSPLDCNSEEWCTDIFDGKSHSLFPRRNQFILTRPRYCIETSTDGEAGTYRHTEEKSSGSTSGSLIVSQLRGHNHCHYDYGLMPQFSDTETGPSSCLLSFQIYHLTFLLFH